MVAPITLNVRHIRGHTFTVEVDHDADTLGLKVVIWESQHIPVDQQRLVFAGKELGDGAKLTVMGITDGAQIFLVESALDDADAAAIAAAGIEIGSDVQPSAVVPPAFAPESGEAAQSGSFMVSMPQPDSRYELVSDEQASSERVSSAIALAKYIRIYCIFGFILTLIGTFDCIWSGVAALFYLLGWIGTRKLNRCMLVFPSILTFLLGFGGMIHLIYGAFEYDIEGYWWFAWVLVFMVCLFHVMIFLSICKLCCRIRKLSCDEWCTARARILTSGCCCCK